MLEDRVYDLEDDLKEIARLQEENQQAIALLIRQSAKTDRRLSDFADEMSEFKEEMSEFKDEMSDFKDEMSDFKDEMADSTRRAEVDRRSMNKAWGDLANKLGTIIEDVVAPNIRRLALTDFGFESVRDMIVCGERSSRRGPDRQREYDVVCAGPRRVIVAESKSSPHLEQIGLFKKSLEEFFDFYPEYDGLDLIGIFSSWALPPKICAEIAAHGLYGIAMGDETMDIVARPLPKNGHKP